MLEAKEIVSDLKPYYYKLYGLNIKSDFHLSELSHNKHNFLESVDVNIICGKCPDSISNAKVSNLYYTVNDTEAIFITKECGRFYISNGNTIIIEPIEKPNYQHLKAYLLSRSFALLMFQRNTVALHGSSIIFDDKAYAFCGQSGAGKSSLSAALTFKGYDLLSDDLSVLALDENNIPLVHSGFCHNKLCKDTMEYFNISSNNLVKVDDFVNKYALPSSKIFIDITYPLSVIIELNVDYNAYDAKEVTIEEIFGHEKLQAVFRNIFRYQLLNDVGLKPLYLKQCLAIAKKIKVFKLTRPNGLFTLNEQIELIKKIRD